MGIAASPRSPGKPALAYDRFEHSYVVRTAHMEKGERKQRHKGILEEIAHELETLGHDVADRTLERYWKRLEPDYQWLRQALSVFMSPCSPKSDP